MKISAQYQLLETRRNQISKQKREMEILELLDKYQDGLSVSRLSQKLSFPRRTLQADLERMTKNKLTSRRGQGRSVKYAKT